mmetsp:Transcript_9945/g.13057  ORF Transcript_9945/g.13057 Transcript_9945/m.13057 type:complete len:249 (-) Transcript_9945:1012-1758(-)
MVKRVAFLNSRLMIFWRLASVVGSMCAVGSSITYTRQSFFNKTRAMARSCRSPTDKLLPPVPTCCLSMVAERPTLFNTFSRSSVGISEKGSKFSSTVPSIKTASWGIIASELRRVLSPRERISWPSSVICPESSSQRRKRQESKVDFPAPVRPTMPIFSPPEIVALKLLSDKGKSGRYLILTFSKWRLPAVGQPRLSRASSLGSIRAGSFGRSPSGRNSKSRSRAGIMEKNIMLKSAERFKKYGKRKA